MMEEPHAFRKFLCHTIAILIVVNWLSTVTTSHANNQTGARGVVPTSLYNYDELQFTLPNSPTSTIRPWPSDKFFRKVLGVRRNSHRKGTNVRQRPNKHHTTTQHHENKHTKKYSWSHYHVKHDSNLTPEAEYKLSITAPPRKDPTELRNQSKLDHKNQSIDNMQSQLNNKPHNTQKPEVISFRNRNNYSASHSISDFNQGKNLPDKGELYSKQYSVEVGNYERPAVLQQNYGIGFQYEISPYQPHSQAVPAKIERQTPGPSLTTLSTTKKATSTTAPSTTRTTADSYSTHLPLQENSEKSGNKPPKNAERSNSWKKIPTLTVTIRPLGELYPVSSTSFPNKRTKTKRPHWGFSTTQHTPASSTHAHYPNPFPFKTRITTTPPPPSVTFAQLEFDTPASPSPATFINSHTVGSQQGFDFDGDFGFPPLLPSPFSPITAAPTQHVHIRPHFETHHQTKINPSDIPSIHSSSSAASFTRPFTNIWYKPIINHFISTAASEGSTTESSSTITHELPSGLIFKVWNYNKNGKLTLVNENVIPSTALEGFQLENGAILNFDQIPNSVQDTVASAILEFNQNQDNLQPFDNPNYGFESSLKASGIGGADDEHGVHYTTNRKPASDRKYVNYVIVEKMVNSPASEIDDIVTKLKPTTFQGNIPLNRQDVLGSKYHSTTHRPKEVTEEPSSASSIDQSWQQLHNLLLSVKDIRLPTPVERDSGTTSTPPSTIGTDSFQTEEPGNKKLMADLAAFAILMSYLSNRTSVNHQRVSPPPLNDTSPSPAQEKTDATPLPNNNPLEIYNHLIQVLRNKTDSQTKTRKTLTTPLPTTEEPQKDKSMLLVKGLVKKGIKKGIKKKKKKKFKKMVSKLVKPLAHIFKKPKEYWFDVKFDVDLYDILKKKFLYYLALKYMPVALVVALKLVPLALLMLPILWKIYWVKKKPKYIRVPVPYPVYKYIKPHHHRRHHYEGSSSHPVSMFQNKDFPDIKFPSGKFPSDKFLSETFPPEKFPENPFHSPPPPPILLKASGLGPHPIEVQNEVNRLNNLRPHTVTHAYELGFDLGSKLGTMSNNHEHDVEVLKILIESRKNKIKRLLKKWEGLRSKTSASTPIHRLGHFPVENNKMEKLDHPENNEIEVHQMEKKQDIPFVKKRRK